MTQNQKMMLFLGRNILKNRNLYTCNQLIQVYRILAWELFPQGPSTHTKDCDCNVCDGCSGIFRMYNRRLINHFQEFDKR